MAIPRMESPGLISPATWNNKIAPAIESIGGADDGATEEAQLGNRGRVSFGARARVNRCRFQLDWSRKFSTADHGGLIVRDGMVYGPKYDQSLLSPSDPDSSSIFPIRNQYPFEPQLGGASIIIPPWWHPNHALPPRFDLSTKDLFHVWISITGIWHQTVVGQSDGATPTPTYRWPIQASAPDPLVIDTSTESGHSHEVALSGEVWDAKGPAVCMRFWEVTDVDITLTTDDSPPAETAADWNIQIGWIDTDVPAGNLPIVGQLLHSDVSVPPMRMLVDCSTGAADPRTGALDGADPEDGKSDWG